MAFAQRALEWRPFRSPRVALQHGIISAAALGPPPGLTTCHIATRLIIHAIVTPALAAARTACQIRPAAVALLDLLTSSTHAPNVTEDGTTPHRPPPRLCDPDLKRSPRAIVAAFDFKTKTILQPMFTLAFSQAAQCLVSKLSSTYVIATPIKWTVSLPVRFWDLNTEHAYLSCEHTLIAVAVFNFSMEMHPLHSMSAASIPWRYQSGFSAHPARLRNRRRHIIGHGRDGFPTYPGGICGVATGSLRHHMSLQCGLRKPMTNAQQPFYTSRKPAISSNIGSFQFRCEIGIIISIVAGY